MERRQFIRISSFTGGLVSVGGLTWLMQACKKERVTPRIPWVVEGNFNSALNIPLSLDATQASLQAKAAKGQIISGKNSSYLAFNGGLPGPTFRAKANDLVNIQYSNQLGEESNIHWHGLVIPAVMDGHPESLVQSGASFNYQFSMQQRAGTYWYHPHPHGRTAYQVYKGLAGFFLVSDSEEESLNLPSGDYELPILIQDKRFYPDYSLQYSPDMNAFTSGYMGQYITVNGRYSCYQSVATRWYRMRVLNGSNARVYNLALSNDASFYVIGSDGGLLSSPEAVKSLMLAPGERADILVDFSSQALGSEVFLISKNFQDPVQGSQEFKIMKFVVSKNETDTFSLPGTLSSIVPISESSASKTRSFVVGHVMSDSGGHAGHGGGGNMEGMHTINNISFEMGRIDETVEAGSTEIWEFDNTIGEEIHPMHVHGVQFQVLNRTGGRGSLIASEKGWKDTVLCMPGEKVRVIMTFPNNTGKFLLHCHNLEHEDSGMMLNYQII